MFVDLIDMFNAPGLERRVHPRVAAPYEAFYTMDGLHWSTATGVDISSDGICVLTEWPLQRRANEVRLRFGKRDLESSMWVVWHEPVVESGRHIHKYAMRFIAIKASDREALGKWIRTFPVERGRKTSDDRPLVRLKADDIERFLPRPLERKLLKELVYRKRLKRLNRNNPPLVSYFYGGTTNGKAPLMHRLTIESKVVRGRNETRYRTRFLFNEDASEIIVVD